MATGRSHRGASVAQALPESEVRATPASHRVPAKEIFAFTQPADALALTQALPAPARDVAYARINRELIESKASPFWQANGRVVVPLPDGGTMSVVIDSSEMLAANRFTSVGRVEGHEGSRAVFAYNEGYLTASIETAERAYAIRPATDELSQVYAIDPTLVPPCGGVLHPVRDAVALASALEARPRSGAEVGASGATTPTVAAAESVQRPEVHLLMLYTPAVKPTMAGAARVQALQSEFDAAVAAMNNQLAASQVSVRVKLVRIAETAYNESASAANKVQEDALTALAKTKDGKMDEIHALRDECGADIVCLALGRSDTSSIGLSYVLDAPAVVDASASVFNPLFAFAVVQYTTVAGTDVVAHEVGHLFGCAHARGDPGTTGTNDGAYTYSYGYRFYGTDGRQYHDIMAYSPGSPLGYYSNPKVVVPWPANARIGIPAGQANEADCALTIEQTAFEVSMYRLQAAAASAGMLVNVSTRAYVGSGEQVLIAGFVIEGSQPKRILVRAAGPALGAFGVTNALANPALQVFGEGKVVGENNDWSSQAGASDVAAATAQVGGFAFTSGSADAAILLTLNPGLYSAVVTGVGGTSGSGLVEVYDVDRTGNRIVNLSTRGYADKGREMFGGFVVNGAAGTTKRILVRVLGPTLGKSYGITGAMDDPMLELHAASGELLIKNDDWSGDTQSGIINAENDFKPAVTTYSEQQIAATGFAPSNRREPCVMLDLPPGNYSVVAQPFERLSGSEPQPASPGVAIVEVYEIVK